jgi:uncharacterized membrane protein YtjA (UPF0391 family)
MLKWVLAFLAVLTLASLLGFTGIAGGAAAIAEVLFFILAVGCVAFLVHEVTTAGDES